MNVLTVKIPEILERKLRIAAAKHNTTRSALARAAIERYLQSDLPPEHRPSAFDLMSEFSGSVEGPPDLSTAKKHMQGYGQ